MSLVIYYRQIVKIWIQSCFMYSNNNNNNQFRMVHVATRNYFIEGVAFGGCQLLNAASTAMSFEWPWQYNFPPFFT